MMRVTLFLKVRLYLYGTAVLILPPSLHRRDDLYLL